MKDSEIDWAPLQRWHEAQEAELEFWKTIRNKGYGGLSYKKWRWYDRIRAVWDYTIGLGYDLAFFKDKIILDIGCGPANLLAGLQAKKRIGIDPLISEYAKLFSLDRGIQYIAGIGESIPLQDNCIDIVFCLNALDHTQTPLSLLKEVVRILHDEGLFILQMNLSPEKEDDKPHPHHFSTDEVSRMLNQAGFQKEKVITKGEEKDDGYELLSFVGILKKQQTNLGIDIR